MRLRADEVQDLGRAQRSGGTVGVGEDMPRAPTPRARHAFNVLTLPFYTVPDQTRARNTEGAAGFGEGRKGRLGSFFGLVVL